MPGLRGENLSGLRQKTEAASGINKKEKGTDLFRATLGSEFSS
jgi:hypothetical protein